jgi:hypothetical protein
MGRGPLPAAIACAALLLALGTFPRIRCETAPGDAQPAGVRPLQKWTKGAPTFNPRDYLFACSTGEHRLVSIYASRAWRQGIEAYALIGSPLMGAVFAPDASGATCNGQEMFEFFPDIQSPPGRILTLSRPAPGRPA